ncbi:MAG: hypothetical protein N3C12_12515 [Candidatus Binatia bacterium]|nr:hypothetical protein [Candidatus Binatia bacterium]
MVVGRIETRQFFALVLGMGALILGALVYLEFRGLGSLFLFASAAPGISAAAAWAAGSAAALAGVLPSALYTFAFTLFTAAAIEGPFAGLLAASLWLVLGSLGEFAQAGGACPDWLRGANGAAARLWCAYVANGTFDWWDLIGGWAGVGVAYLCWMLPRRRSESVGGVPGRLRPVAFLGVLCSGVVFMVGSAAAPPMSQLQIRELQTRSYPTKDTKMVLKALLAVFQDEGFIVKHADRELGLVSATKEVDVESPLALLLALGADGSEARWAKVTVIECSATVSEFGEETKVRLNCQTKTFNNRGEVMEVHTIVVPEYYQQFFSKVDKGLFLEKEQL